MEHEAGKYVGGALYFHVSALDSFPEAVSDVNEAERVAGIEQFRDYTVVKLSDRRRCISLLNYAEFFEEAFPALATAWTVDLESRTVQRRDYDTHRNPPILHRKELLLDPSHPRIGEYRALTEALEQAGLYQAMREVGFWQQWHQRLERAGFRVDGHKLIPVSKARPSNGSDLSA